MQHRDVITLRRYLLGELSDSERSRLAQRYFIDEEFFDRLLDLENELLDEYVSGQLSADERKAFGDYLVGLPGVASKLATAFVLREAARQEQNVSPASSGEVVPVSALTGGMLREWFFGGQVLRYASAAVVLVLLAGTAYLIVTQRQLRRNLPQQRAERIQTEREKEILSPDTEAAKQQQAAELDRLRQQELKLSQERKPNAQKLPARGKNAGRVVASLILTPSLRSGGTPEVLMLAPTVKTVELIIPNVNREQISSYRAVLQTIEGRVVLTKEGLHPQRSRGSVTLSFPAARLTGDSFKLTLQGRAADGLEIAQDHYFNVVRK
ncbi:MAG: hypothetical protein AABN95_22485 [Acidobacteriota bacterium]